MHSPIPGTNKVPTPRKVARGLREGRVQLALTKETLRASGLGIQTQEPQDYLLEGAQARMGIRWFLSACSQSSKMVLPAFELFLRGWKG